MSLTQGPRIAAPRGAGIREIVVVDQDETLRAALTRDLRPLQIQVRGFQSGAEALVALQQSPPDVLITDVNVQPGDGFAFAQQIRQLPGARDLPILVTSEVVFRAEVLADAKAEYGFSDIIYKPYSLQHLLTKLRLLTGTGSASFRLQQPTLLTKMPEPELVFLDQLGRVLRDLRSGSLQCDRGDHAVHLYFRNGKLVAVDSGYVGPQELGVELLRRGLLSDSQFDSLLNHQDSSITEQRDWIGRLLIDSGRIRPEQVAEVLTEQAALRFKKLFGWRSGTFRFKEGQSPLPGALRFNFNLTALVFEALGEYGNVRVFQEMLERYPLPLRAMPDAADALVGIQLSASERRLLREMNRRSLGRAVAETGVQPERAYTLIMLLLTLGLLEADDARGNELREQVFGLASELPLAQGPGPQPEDDATFTQAYGRAYRYMNLGLMAQAEEEFSRAVQVRPGDARAICYLAWCRYRSRDGQEAFQSSLELMQKAAALEPTLATVHVLRGRMLMEQGLVREAQDALFKALEVDQGNDEAMEALQSLLRDKQERQGGPATGQAGSRRGSGRAEPGMTPAPQNSRTPSPPEKREATPARGGLGPSGEESLNHTRAYTAGERRATPAGPVSRAQDSPPPTSAQPRGPRDAGTEGASWPPRPPTGERPAQRPPTGERPAQRPPTGERPLPRPPSSERPALGRTLGSGRRMTPPGPLTPPAGPTLHGTQFQHQVPLPPASRPEPTPTQQLQQPSFRTPAPPAQPYAAPPLLASPQGEGGPPGADYPTAPPVPSYTPSPQPGPAGQQGFPGAAAPPSNFTVLVLSMEETEGAGATNSLYTTRSQSNLKVEILRHLLNAGGTLEEYRRDRTVCLFGYPFDPVNHQLHALKLGLELREVISRHLLRSGIPLQNVRLRTVIVSGQRNPLGGGDSSLAETLRVADLLLARAMPWEMFVSQEAARGMEEYFEFAAIEGPQEPKALLLRQERPAGQAYAAAVTPGAAPGLAAAAGPARTPLPEPSPQDQPGIPPNYLAPGAGMPQASPPEEARTRVWGIPAPPTIPAPPAQPPGPRQQPSRAPAGPPGLGRPEAATAAPTGLPHTPAGHPGEPGSLASLSRNPSPPGRRAEGGLPQPPPSFGVTQSNPEQWDRSPGSPIPTGEADDAEEGGYQPGYQLGNFKLVRQLGKGGMGRVYEAVDQALGRKVAIKIMNRRVLGTGGAKERFREEARALARLNCPQIIQIYSLDLDHTPPYLVLEFVDGASLREILSERQRLGAAQALEIALETARGLRVANERGIIHRDINPRNVMFSRDGEVKIGDFGLAKSKVRDMSLTSTGAILGTPLYMSPEQWKGEPTDFRADVYSLGVTLYHLIMGVPPFDAETVAAVMLKHLSAALPEAISRQPGVGSALVRLLRRMMAKDPLDRHGSYQDLLREMEEALAAMQGGGGGGGSNGGGSDSGLRRRTGKISL